MTFDLSGEGGGMEISHSPFPDELLLPVKSVFFVTFMWDFVQRRTHHHTIDQWLFNNGDL